MCDFCNSKTKFKDLEDYICIEEKKNEKKEAALIAVLHKAQGLYGYLGKEVQEYIAKRLDIPASKVYGVITFYSYFTTKPKGKYVISVCTGTACFVRGVDEILTEFKKELGINTGETTEDGMFTLDTLRCVGSCAIAPVVLVNDTVYGNFNKKDVHSIVNQIKENF